MAPAGVNAHHQRVQFSGRRMGVERHARARLRQQHDLETIGQSTTYRTRDTGHF